MKYRAYTFFCLLIMTCYILRPVFPFIDYMINKEYIAKHLCIKKNVPENSCHGECYLHKQLQKSQDEYPTDKNSNKEKIQNNKVDDHLIAKEINVPHGEIKIRLIYLFKIQLFISHPNEVFVPPNYG
jgi:hypothetical protein